MSVRSGCLLASSLCRRFAAACQHEVLHDQTLELLCEQQGPLQHSDLKSRSLHRQRIWGMASWARSMCRLCRQPWPSRGWAMAAMEAMGTCLFHLQARQGNEEAASREDTSHRIFICHIGLYHTPCDRALRAQHNLAQRMFQGRGLLPATPCIVCPHSHAYSAKLWAASESWKAVVLLAVDIRLRPFWPCSSFVCCWLNLRRSGRRAHCMQ